MFGNVDRNGDEKYSVENSMFTDSCASRIELTPNDVLNREEVRSVYVEGGV